jgi:hypothetical protein
VAHCKKNILIDLWGAFEIDMDLQEGMIILGIK